jgi:hypothetical protein
MAWDHGETHKVVSTSTVPSALKADFRAKYQAIHQGSVESIVGTRSDSTQHRKATKIWRIIAVDFMRGLDNARYSEFKANLLNDLLIPGAKAHESLNAMYTRAAA